MHIVIVRFLYITYQGTHKVTILHIIIIMEDKCVSSFNIPVTLFHSSIIRQMAPRISWILLWQLRAKNSSPFKLCKAEAEIERGSAEKCSQISSTWEDSYCRRADKNRQWALLEIVAFINCFHFFPRTRTYFTREDIRSMAFMLPFVKPKLSKSSL